MKLFSTIIFIFSLSFALFAQNQWSYEWKLSEKPFQPPQTASEMAIVKGGFDTDEDGWGEFICAYTDLDENYILMYEATDANTYELVWYWMYPVQANTFAGIAVGYIDENDVIDIVTTMPAVVSPETPNPPRLWVFEWNGVQGENKYGKYTGTDPEPTGEWNYNVADNIDFRPYSLTIEDMDGDGKNELVTGVRSGDRGKEVMVSSVLGQLSGFGTWQVEYNLQDLSGGSLYSVTTGDLDNDGSKEIYAMVWNLFSLYIIESTGTDSYELVNSLETVYSSQGIDYGALDGIRVADVNNDNVNEMYIAGTEPENTLFIVTDINDVSAITADDIQELMHIPAQAGGKFRATYIDDPDHDGKADIMIAGELNGQIFDVEYKGSGSPADSANWDINIAFDLFEYGGFDPDSANTIDPRLFYGYPCGDLDNDDKDEYLFVNYRTNFDLFTDDAYVWMIQSDALVGVEDEDILPENYSLSNNYPNPFNPATKISFSLPENQFVQLKVFDVLGNEVATLVENDMNRGVHNVTFDATNIASGIYFYSITAGEFTQTKKMILMK